jgi:ATP-dependent DNA helicase RecQ
VQKLLSCIIRTNSRYGAAYVIDVLLGSRQKRILENHHDELSTYGIGRELDREEWFEVVNALLDQEYLTKTEDYGVLQITVKGSAALRARDKFKLPLAFARQSHSAEESLAATSAFVPKSRGLSGANGGMMFPKPAGKKSRSKKQLSADYTRLMADALTENGTGKGAENAALIDALKKWRRKQASELNVPPYVIFGDKTLYELVALKPRSREDLLMVTGIGENKADRFGREILRVIEKLE